MFDRVVLRLWHFSSLKCTEINIFCMSFWALQMGLWIYEIFFEYMIQYTVVIPVSLFVRIKESTKSVVYFLNGIYFEVIQK